MTLPAARQVGALLVFDEAKSPSVSGRAYFLHGQVAHAGVAALSRVPEK